MVLFYYGSVIERRKGVAKGAALLTKFIQPAEWILLVVLESYPTLA